MPIHPTRVPSMSVDAGREKLKQDGVNIADWLTALALFTGHAAKVRCASCACAPYEATSQALLTLCSAGIRTDLPIVSIYQ